MWRSRTADDVSESAGNVGHPRKRLYIDNQAGAGDVSVQGQLPQRPHASPVSQPTFCHPPTAKATLLFLSPNLIDALRQKSSLAPKSTHPASTEEAMLPWSLRIHWAGHNREVVDNDTWSYSMSPGLLQRVYRNLKSITVQ